MGAGEANITLHVLESVIELVLLLDLLQVRHINAAVEVEVARGRSRNAIVFVEDGTAGNRRIRVVECFLFVDCAGFDAGFAKELRADR